MLIPQRKLLGFTLIELIVVIVLVSIVSVVAASRFLNRSGFSVIAAQEQAIAITQQIQLGRMQSNISDISDIGELNSRYQLAIKDSCFGSRYSCTLANPEEQSDYLALDNIQVSAPTSLLNFDLLGRPVCESCTYPITIQFTQFSESASICINSEGFVDAC
ncbi:prepilin-type N-terminal cleavage/methylation domain-containing protein [Vibrio barjaei]|uniref:Prepilin-type N-terminal cleavage/methylation domain-containing protein n=1 Tax=Vibrio barjaei TaxID=1676683 RepID=A0ABW7IL84_9VIBR